MAVSSSEADRVSVQNLLKDYSVELTVRQASRIDRFDGLLAPATRVYIPHTPNTRFEDILALAVRRTREPPEPVPHLVARRLRSVAAADDFLARLVADAGVTQV